MQIIKSRTGILLHKFHPASTGAPFMGARFDHRELAEADLSGIEFSRGAMTFCNLEGASFSDARLSQVSFDLSNLRHTKWKGARLDRVYVNGADLTGASLTEASFDIIPFYYDDNTIWPADFDPEAYGCRKI